MKRMDWSAGPGHQWVGAPEVLATLVADRLAQAWGQRIRCSAVGVRANATHSCRAACGLNPADCTASVMLNRRPGVSVPRGRPELEIEVAESHGLGESALATRDEGHGDDLGCTGVTGSDD